MERTTQTEREVFEDLVANADRWSTIDDLIALCDANKMWSKEFISGCTVQAKKAHIRRLIKQSKDESGWPVWASVEMQDASGKTIRVYKQETLFDVDDYRQAAEYWVDRSSYAKAMATGYARRCKKRFNKTIQLRFPEMH